MSPEFPPLAVPAAAWELIVRAPSLILVQLGSQGAVGPVEIVSGGRGEGILGKGHRGDEKSAKDQQSQQPGDLGP